MGKQWTVFAYEPDINGHIYYGLRDGSHISASSWNNKLTADLVCAAWNGEDAKIAEIADKIITAVRAIDIYSELAIQEKTNGQANMSFEPIVELTKRILGEDRIE